MCSEMILNVLYHIGHDTATLTSDSKEAQNFMRPLLTSPCTLPTTLYKLGKKLCVTISERLEVCVLHLSFLQMCASHIYIFFLGNQILHILYEKRDSSKTHGDVLTVLQTIRSKPRYPDVIKYQFNVTFICHQRLLSQKHRTKSHGKLCCSLIR